jgi:succinate dehydrogenase / fumarate reductase membrane anchor subunit
MSMRKQIGIVRGLGSARDGTGHFWLQRLTSIASLLLTVFAIALAISLVGEPHAVVAARLGSPFVAVALLATIFAYAYHMQLGMQVIIEDYVQSEPARVLALIGNIFFCFAVGLISAFAVLKLGFGG